MKITSRFSCGMVAVPLMASLLFLPGCFDNKAQQGAGIGALGGGMVGGLLGPSKNREQNALIGAAVGGALGYLVGHEMDQNDQIKVNQALETNRSYQTSRWVNPDSGTQYAVTPHPAQQVDGRECREMEIQTLIDGKTNTQTKVACRNTNGQWEI